MYTYFWPLFTASGFSLFLKQLEKLFLDSIKDSFVISFLEYKMDLRQMLVYLRMDDDFIGFYGINCEESLLVVVFLEL